jgi:hypothetical protein
MFHDPALTVLWKTQISMLNQFQPLGFNHCASSQFSLSFNLVVISYMPQWRVNTHPRAEHATPTAKEIPHSTSTLCHNLHSLAPCSNYLHTLSVWKNFHTPSRYFAYSSPHKRHARYHRQSHSVNLASLISTTFTWPNALLIIYGALSRNQIKRSLQN